MEDQPSRKKQRVSNPNNCDPNADIYSGGGGGNELGGQPMDSGGMPNGSMLNGGGSGGMQMGGMGGGGPMSHQQPPMHTYHGGPPPPQSNGPAPPQGAMMSMPMTSQPPQMSSQQQPPQQQSSILQNLLLNNNSSGAMNSPRQPQYNNSNFNSNRDIRSPANNGGVAVHQNMMSPPTSGMAMQQQQSRMHAPPHTQIRMPGMPPPNANGPGPGGPQGPRVYGRRPMPGGNMQGSVPPPQQWSSGPQQGPGQPPMNMGYMGPPQQQQQQLGPPSNMGPGGQQAPPPQQRGPPQMSGQPQQQMVGNYSSPQQPQMHQGMGGGQPSAPPGSMPPMSVMDGSSMMMNAQGPGPQYSGVPPGSFPPPHSQAGGGPPPSIPPQGPGSNNNNRSQPSLQSQDPEKRKLIQQQLVLLLHAHRCQQRERSEGGQGSQCALAHCSTMKSVLDHMITCNNGRQCTFAHCASSRQIITHWKNCTKDDCPVCKPLKSFSRSGSANPPSHMGNVGHLQSQSSFDGATQNLLMDYNPTQSDPFRSTNPPNKVAPSNGSNMGGGGGPSRGGPPSFGGGGGGGADGFANLPPPDMPTVTKEWHSSITQDLRNHLVGKLVKAIFPSPDPSAIHDQRIRDLIAYARKVEKEMFECANDKEEYYHLLAEKIYKIQKELQEKKNRRINDQGGQSGAMPPQGPPGSGPMMNHMGSGPPGSGYGGQHMPGSQMSGMGPPHSSQSYQFPYSQDQPNPMQATPQQQQAQMQRPQSQTSMAGPMSIPPSSSSMQQQMGGGLQQQQQQQAPPQNHMQAHDQTAQPMQHQMNNNIKSEMPDVRNSEPMLQKQDSIKSEPVDTPLKNATPAERPAKRTSSPPANQPPVKREAREEPPTIQEKKFDANELRSYLKPICDKLLGLDESIPFRVPVDVEALKIPDYYDIIKNPMDLQTIGKKLDSGQYENPWQFCDDMWLMFENAWLYNKKNSRVYKYCTKLSEVFIEAIDPVMRQMGFCCGHKLSFTPLALICYGQAACSIARDQPYFMYETGSSQFGVTVSDRYIYCPKCFDALPPEGLNLNENPNEPPNLIPKDRFQQLKNDKIEPEPFEICKLCRRKWHRICALYSKKVFPEGFICETCRTERSIPRPENKFTAKRLPHCQLSKYIENRVNGFIKQNLPQKPVSKDNYEVVIRVLCASEKEVEVKPMMKERYGPEGFPEKFPYKTKAIFAFEVIDGVEVCFFGLHVQEYGSQCPPPNRRRVYIAYLDSVHFFQPRELRTDVYHEILLGYLEYVKKLGYTMAHIWACPPSEGDDYIFHCHPPEQKIPKPKRLQDWYKRMLEKGQKEDTVYEYKDIHKQAKDDNLQTPKALPYFEGDFWPNVVEDCIREVQKEEMERKKLEEQMAAADDNEDEDLFQTDDGVKLKKNNKSSKKKNNLKKLNKQKKKNATGTGNEVTDKLYNLFEKHKDIFFTIRLVSQQTELSVNNTEINDPDPLMSSELMDGRDTFLCRARDEHWEFSSMRRAKYSTLNFCYALHTQDNKEMTTYTCNNCNSTNAAWHCNTCEDYDLCQNCREVVKHEHHMEKIVQLAEGRTDDSASARNESFKRCIQSLVHACQCRDANCRRHTCLKMKRVVQHTKVCKRRQTTTCPVCKQLIMLCCAHARSCQAQTCPVPFCANIRAKLQEQKRAQNRHADMMMRRRFQALNTTNAPPASLPSASSSQSSMPSSSQPMQQHSSMQMQGHGGAMHDSKPIMAAHHAPNPAVSMNGPVQQQQNQYAQQSMAPNRFNPQQQPQQYHAQQQIQGGGQMPQGGGQMQGSMSMQQQQQQRMHPGAPNQQYGQQQMQGRPLQGGGQMHQVNGPPMNGSNMQPYQQQQMGGPNKMNPNVMQQHPNAQYHQQMGGGGNIPPGQIGGGMMGQQQMPPMHQQRMQGGPPQQHGMNPQQQQQRMAASSMESQLSAADADPNTNPQVRQILNRLKTMSSPEERKRLFADLKKTPHLFAAFLKMKNSNDAAKQQQQQQNQQSGQGGSNMPGGKGPNQPPPPQQQFYSQN